MSVNAEQLFNEQSKKLRQIAASTGLMAGAGGFVRYSTGTDLNNNQQGSVNKQG